jgi:EAL domain-containing protein (putative c-di-GMP-specific phosphodiesterase class I)
MPSVDHLKVDRSFVRDLGKNDDDGACDGVAEPYDVVEGIVECVELELTAVDGASQV